MTDKDVRLLFPFVSGGVCLAVESIPFMKATPFHCFCFQKFRVSEHGLSRREAGGLGQVHSPCHHSRHPQTSSVRICHSSSLMYWFRGDPIHEKPLPSPPIDLMTFKHWNVWKHQVTTSVTEGTCLTSSLSTLNLITFKKLYSYLIMLISVWPFWQPNDFFKIWISTTSLQWVKGLYLFTWIYSFPPGQEGDPPF